MEERPKLFVYDKKEIAVLMLLGVMIAVFAFTLGVHLGKRVTPKETTAEHDTAPLETHGDKAPTRHDVAEMSAQVDPSSEEAMNQALHDEVQRQGIKLDQPRPVELPKDTVAKEAGAKEGHQDTVAKDSSKAAAEHETLPAGRGGKFTLQVGSFPTIGEARALRDSLEAHGLKPSLKSAKVSGKGTWYRVFVGSFATREEADQMGERFQGKNFIESFVVTNFSE